MARERPHHSYIGSSDAPPIVGVPSYGITALEVWEEKMRLSIPRDEKAEMRWGNRLEPIILAAYEEATGRKVDRKARQRFHADYPFIGCRVDATADDRIVEAKFTPWGDFGEPADGEAGLPPYVRVQVKHQMLVTGHRIVDVPVLVRGYDLRIFTVEADPDYLEDLLEEEVDWWTAYVVPRIPPPVDDPEALGRFLSRRHVDTGVEIEATPEQAATLADLRLARATTKASKAAEAVLSNALKRVMEDAGASVLIAPGIGKATFRTYPSRSLAWEQIATAYRTKVVELVKLAHPTILTDEGRDAILDSVEAVISLYTTEGETTRFTPTFPKEGPTDAE